MTSVADLDFTVALTLTNSPAPFDGLTVRACGDPLRTYGAFVIYETEEGHRYGYLGTSAAADLRGRRWGTGLLYDVDGSADGTTPVNGAPLGRGFRQRAEVEFGYAEE